MNVGFLVQLADGGGRDLAAPQCLGDVLHTAHGNASQVHLDERFLHAALPATIPLDDGSLERYALEPGQMCIRDSFGDDYEVILNEMNRELVA